MYRNEEKEPLLKRVIMESSEDDPGDFLDKVPILNNEISTPDDLYTNDSLSSQGYSTYIRPAHVETGTYWYRWYILGLFSCIAMMSNISWNTWGPIEESARVSFGFSKGTISLLSDWGAITFIIAVFPSAYILDVLGLRKATILAAGFLTLGTVVRCIFTFKHKKLAPIFIHAGQIFIGFCGPVGQSSATVLSSTWFPPHQRTTATAIGSLASYTGTALSFILGPHLVKEFDASKYTPGTAAYNEEVENVGDQIMRYLYIQCGIVGFLLLLVLLSYPGKPPKPPSATATIERVDFKDGLKKLMKNPQFQLIAFAYGMSTGVYSAWCSDLAINLSSFNIDDKVAGMLGFWAVIAGAISGIALAITGDSLGGLKLILILLFIVASACFTVFSLICVKVIPSTLWLYYMTCILGGLTLNGSIPLFFELAVESSYPVAEGVNTGFMTFSNNVYCTIFLSLPLINGVGTHWMNWFLVASCLVVIPTLLLFKERYRRLEQDLAGDNFSPLLEDQSMKYPCNGDSIGSSVVST